MTQIVRIVLALALLTCIGTAGFCIIEGWSVFDALYMTVISLTTVGYLEVHELSTPGRAFVMIFLATGLGVFLFGVVQLGELAVGVQLREWMGRRRMQTTILTIRDHFIVCGFGRLGRRLCQELAGRKLPFVVVEQDEAVLAPCQAQGWCHLVGDATEDATLQAAGISRARGLATVLASDAMNLYVVLSARLLAKDLQILARASTEKDAEKLTKAGANRVISLYATGASKMAQLLANPKVEDFIEVITAKGKQVDLAEVQVTATASYAGKPLAESDLRQRGVIVVGIRRASGDLLLPPGGNDIPQPGDCLIALGKADCIQQIIEER